MHHSQGGLETHPYGPCECLLTWTREFGECPTYSSLFLASSLVTLLKEREERWQAIAGKLRTRGHTEGPTRLIGREEAAQPDTRSPDRIDGSRGVARRRPVQTTHLGGAVPPRPRKKRR